MVQVTINKQTFYIDGFAKASLDKAKELSQKDWDSVFLIDGVEGGGKSVIAQQLAYYCDPTLDIERIVFNGQEFQDAIRKAKQYEAVIYDEAYNGLSSRGTMSAINRDIVTMLAEIRQKNLFVFIVMPTFFDLDKYAAIWRSKVLINIYTGGDSKWERGYFKWYDSETKKQLYLKGKKFYNYNAERCSFFGRFTNKYLIDEQQYRTKKLKALSTRKSTKEIKSEQRFIITLKALCNHLPLRKVEQELKDLGLDMSYARISQILTEYDNKREEISYS